jgi:hypothetical protein
MKGRYIQITLLIPTSRLGGLMVPKEDMYFDVMIVGLK